jgi:hypothetical protein
MNQCKIIFFFNFRKALLNGYQLRFVDRKQSISSCLRIIYQNDSAKIASKLFELTIKDPNRFEIPDNKNIFTFYFGQLMINSLAKCGDDLFCVTESKNDRILDIGIKNYNTSAFNINNITSSMNF